MRSALQAASANEKTLGHREEEIKVFKLQLAELESTKAKSVGLENKIAALESEVTSVSPDAVQRHSDDQLD
jgi:uncharacterized protein YlxW (UPF0749 family)